MSSPLEKRLKHLLIVFLRVLLRSKPVPLPPLEMIRRILIIRQHNQLGDMLCVVPLLRELRKKFPSAFIALVASPANVDAVLHNCYLDEVINFDKREFLKGWRLRIGRFIAFVKGIRQQRFDLAIVPSTVSVSFTSHLLAYLTGAPFRIGAGSIDGKENPSSFLLNLPVELDWRSMSHRHQTLRNLDVARPIGIQGEDLSAELTLTEHEIDEGKRIFLKGQETRAFAIGFHPGAGKIPNCWPPRSFANTANTLAREFDAAIFITVGPMDDMQVSQMVRDLDVPYYLLKDLPVRLVGSVISNLKLFISNDTGLMHVAASVGVPVLSLFGPTDSKQWAPIGSQHRCIVGEGGQVSSITVEEVLREARDMLRKAGG